jgi:hypothetical protein
MPTVIDSLIIELGIDPKKLTGGEQAFRTALRRMISEASRGAKQADSETKKLGETISTLKRQAIGAVSAFFGGRTAGQLVNYVTTLDASTERLAKTFGVATEELSAWQGAAKRVGGSAESANSSLGGLNQEMVRLQLTGQASFLPLLNFLHVGLNKTNGELKTASELLLDISGALEHADKRQAATLLSMIPGMNQDTVNLLLLGRKELERVLETQRQIGGTTKESAQAAQEYQAALSDLDRAATHLGRTLLTVLGPGLTGALERFTKVFQELSQGKVISPDSLLGRWLGIGGGNGTPAAGAKAMLDARGRFATIGAGAGAGSPERGGAGAGSASNNSGPGRAAPAEMEAYIRKAALARGIDPNIAVAVAKSEGLYDYVGDRGSSFGPFQLHYGGVASGGNAVGGLGDTFTKRTGLNARDPSTWPQQVDFALDEARKSGWGAWHGWKGLPRAGIGAMPSAGALAGGAPGASGAANTTTVSVQQLTVNTQATDGEGVARDIVPALKRLTMTAQANAGAQ